MASTRMGNLTQVSDGCFTVIGIYVILQDKVWFAGDCNRKIAEDLLLRVNKVNKQLNDGRAMYSLFTIPLLFCLPAPFWPPLSHQNLHFLLHPFLFPIPAASFAQIIPYTSIFPCCRMAPFSSDTAQPKTPGSRTPSLCSTSRRCTTFPSASWRRRGVTPSEKRARRTKR